MNIVEAVNWCNEIGRGSLIYYVVYRPKNNDYVTHPHSHIKRHPTSKIVYNSKDKMLYFYPLTLILPYKT